MCVISRRGMICKFAATNTGSFLTGGLLITSNMSYKFFLFLSFPIFFLYLIPSMLGQLSFNNFLAFSMHRLWFYHSRNLCIKGHPMTDFLNVASECRGTQRNFLSISVLFLFSPGWPIERNTKKSYFFSYNLSGPATFGKNIFLSLIYTLS